MKYMFAPSVSTIANEWKKYEGYTIRPLPSTVAYYEKKIYSLSDQHQFLMYGGTPEIRNIFQEQNWKVTLFDQSKEMIHAMGHLTKLNQPLSSHEYFVQSNWLEKFSFHNLFDLVIGDDVINMISFDQFDFFLKKTSELLSDQGVFICHLLVKPDEALINQTFHEVFREYEMGIIKSKYDLASRLNFICFDKDSYGMGWQRTIKMIGNQLDHFKPGFDFVDTFGFCNSHFFCPPKNQFEKLACQYFTIEEIFYPHEHEYCLFEPVYILNKKRRHR